MNYRLARIKHKSFQGVRRFAKITVTNGPDAQGENGMDLQTLFKPVYVKPSSHPIGGVIKSNDDAELVKAQITGERPDGLYGNVAVTNGNNLKQSLEEFDPVFNTNPLPVIQTDSAGRKAELDNLFKIPITIDVQHHEIHEGDSFSSTHNATLANGGTISLSFKTPNTAKQPHLTFLGRSSGEANVCLNEGVAATSGTGNSHPVYNRKRDSTNDTDLLEDTAGGGFVAGSIAEGATVAGGTCIYEEHFGAGQTRGGATAGRNEFLLAPDTEYEIVLTSEAAANDCEVILDWYEHTGE